MPAAAVIPAPVAYIKVVAVKKLVVEILYGTTSSDDRAVHPPEQRSVLCCRFVIRHFTLSKLECSRQASA